MLGRLISPKDTYIYRDREITQETDIIEPISLLQELVERLEQKLRQYRRQMEDAEGWRLLQSILFRQEKGTLTPV
jgi:hypothetical protein